MDFILKYIAQKVLIVNYKKKKNADLSVKQKENVNSNC